MRPIDADALKELIDGGFDIDFDEVPETKKALLNMIDEQPTADVVERKMGKWETTRPDAPMFGFYYCSLCGRKRTSPQDHFCPNCGADMRGEEE